MYYVELTCILILIPIILLNKAAYTDIIQGEWTPIMQHN